MSADLKMPVMKKVEPPRRGGNKLLLLLAVFFVTVLVVLFFHSSISKVARIEISGNELATSEAIGQASRVKVGDNFFLLRSPVVANRIRQVKTIESVTVRKRFPGTVQIAVKEFPRVAFQQNADSMVVLLADGSAVALQTKTTDIDRPILTGWKDDDPLKARLCQTLADIPSPLLSDISEIRPDPSVSYADKIKIYTRSRFEVYTTVGYLPRYIQYLGDMIKTMKDQNEVPGVITMLETAHGEAVGASGGGTDAKQAGKDTRGTDAKQADSKTAPPKDQKKR